MHQLHYLFHVATEILGTIVTGLSRTLKKAYFFVSVAEAKPPLRRSFEIQFFQLVEYHAVLNNHTKSCYHVVHPLKRSSEKTIMVLLIIICCVEECAYGSTIFHRRNECTEERLAIHPHRITSFSGCTP